MNLNVNTPGVLMPIWVSMFCFLRATGEALPSCSPQKVISFFFYLGTRRGDFLFFCEILEFLHRGMSKVHVYAPFYELHNLGVFVWVLSQLFSRQCRIFCG